MSSAETGRDEAPGRGPRWRTWEDQPTVTAPGDLVVSTRALSPVGALGTPDDVGTLDPAHVPFHRHLSGTSMAAPHVAGVAALMLDARPTMTPAQVKAALVGTAGPMAGYDEFEVGAGYVDAYGAVQEAFGRTLPRR